jgi:hypothetical protein
MNHLVAKSKGKKAGYHKLISNKKIFDLPADLDNHVSYKPEYKLEEDEWYSISDFSEQEYCTPFLKTKFVSTDYDQIATKDYGTIEYLCSYQDGIYFFQKITPSQLVRRRYLTLANTPELVDNESLITINKFADAIYNKEDDTLYFRSLSTISTIFRGIDVLYREATQEETEKFLKNDFVKLGTSYTPDQVKKANRKRIAMAMDTLDKFSPKDKKSIYKYIQEYCKDLQFDKKASSFTIDTEDDLKLLLYGIEQRYYTTILGGEKRLANSITTI